MSRFSIAGIQMHVTMNNNIAEMRKRLEVLFHSYPWVQMVVFSELSPHGPNKTASRSPSVAPLNKSSPNWPAALIAGLFRATILRKTATTFTIRPRFSTRRASCDPYRKIFPFTPYETGVTPGAEFCVFDVPDIGRFGVSICYDLWFPEVTRTLTQWGQR